MLLRGAILVVAGSLLAGCANNQPFSTGLAPPAQAAETEPVLDRDPSRKTMASKVLSAIALERVTGRKPDPARLNELR
jgi:type IV pilus biogenesis protein CpaD/CtpE